VQANWYLAWLRQTVPFPVLAGDPLTSEEAVPAVRALDTGPGIRALNIGTDRDQEDTLAALADADVGSVDHVLVNAIDLIGVTRPDASVMLVPEFAVGRQDVGPSELVFDVVEVGRE
jgi:hypothetical protein